MFSHREPVLSEAEGAQRNSKIFSLRFYRRFYPSFVILLPRKLRTRNTDEFYAQLKTDVLLRINPLGLGPQRFGADTTALHCLIRIAPSHIASLTGAANIQCPTHKSASVCLSKLRTRAISLVREDFVLAMRI